MKKLTLVTVTCNSRHTLYDTINSVLQQTYPYIEYIIIDGASTDNTVGVIKQYEHDFNERLRWISEKDDGLYDAMNKGFSMATGDVIGIINSDDVLADPAAIEKVVKCFERDETIDAVYADLYYVAQNDISKIVRHWVSGEQRSFAKGWHPAHPTFYVKKEIYHKYGTFDLDFKFAADFELMLRLIEKYHIKLHYLPEPLVRMRLGGTTSKNLSNIRKGNIECINAFKKNNIPVSRFYPLFRLLPKLKQYFQ
ncbi:glycosyltransferase family 2 protein [Bacteroides fragilis]|uniref:glycosyltransferase family 2 protein n=1 Tax=Bacteroides fragilis TaxID=817 RepID=UPI003219A3BC